MDSYLPKLDIDPCGRFASPSDGDDGRFVRNGQTDDV
jgi:hypothetical protein